MAIWKANWRWTGNTFWSSGCILSHAFALFVAVSVRTNVSGSLVNPTVTFGAFIGGNITFLRSTLYWIAQLFGIVVTYLFLKLSIDGMEITTFLFSYGVMQWIAVAF